MIIGITGLSAAGKDTVADILEQKDFANFSLSDIIREYCRSIGQETTRENLIAAVIVRDRAILSSGYNGAPRGMAHCDEAGHELVDGHCIRTAHCEANAIAQAAKNGTSIDVATIYSTASPCYDCFKLIINAGIKRVCYGQYYGSRYNMSENVLKLAKGGHIECDYIEIPKS